MKGTKMRKLTARRNDQCRGCGTAIRRGQTIAWSRETGAYHENCAPSGDRQADSQYYQGIQDAERWRENRRLFGDQMADAMELERELREGWD